MSKFLGFTLIFTISILISSCDSTITEVGKENKSPASNTYQDMEKLPQKYTPESAQKNGDVVGVHGKCYNIEKLDKFIEEFKNKQVNKENMIRITTYTDEGDPIILDLIIEGKSMNIIIDNTRDKFSSIEDRQIREYIVADIFKQNQNGRIYYAIRTDNEEELPLILVNNATLKEQSNIIENKLDVREIVWNQLISKDNSMEGNWQDGKLSRITLYRDAGIIINDKSYIGKEVYFIDFKTKSLRIPNNIIVYVSMDNNKIIGYGIVD